MRRLMMCAVVLAAALTAPAFAQSSSSDLPPSSAESAVPDDLQSFVGDWLLAQEDDSAPRCPISFTDQQAIGGFAVVFPETCPAPYPTDRITAWNVDDSDFAVLLLDAERHVVMRLNEDEDGLYDTAEGSNPRFYLLSPYDEDGAGGEQDSD